MLSSNVPIYSQRFIDYCQKIGKTPVLPDPLPPRSASISEEIGVLTKEYQEDPDKRWSIVKRGSMLRSALARHPQWNEEARLERDVMETLL